MKKSLLIILSLLLAQITTFAVGVDCWEEISGSYTAESKMKNTVGAATIVKVSTFLEAPMVQSVIYDTACNKTYGAIQYQKTKFATTNAGTFTLVDTPITPSAGTYADYLGPKAGIHFATDPFTTHANLKGVVWKDSYAYTSGCRDLRLDGYRLLGPYYIHTYCIANTNSGSGGAAGAAVNYIIKAD